ncbi:hypothetical protein [Halalkalicoccus ordinarius]|uniref:hypothetical protein n=1 Tax=Halalkalicoccus ordinarius TaxID=3116651 RepID=UPI00300E84BA
MSRQRHTRRAVIAATGTAVAAGTITGRYVGNRPSETGSDIESDPDDGPADLDRAIERRIAPDAVTDRDLETIYPLVTYNDRTGWYDVTMPVNVRFDLTGSEYGIESIEELLGIRTGWARIVAAAGSYWPDSDAKPPDVWDPARDRLVAPVANYRKPIGPLTEGLCYHVYLWPVRVEEEVVGVAAQTHKDVGSIRDHIGTDFAEAATQFVSLYEAEGWTAIDADFDAGVDAGLREFWGPTGDRILIPPGT